MTQPPVANTLAGVANTPDDYARFGLSSTSIEPWEDGARTDDSAGTYEWWYFDAHLDAPDQRITTPAPSWR